MPKLSPGMDILYIVLLVLHISSAALLFGGGLGMVKNLKRSLEAGQATFSVAAQDAARRGSVIGAASLATLATGLGLIFAMGGFKSVPFTIHIALTLMLLAIGVSAALIKPSTARLVQFAQAEALEKEKVGSAIKKIAMGSGILHLIWITNLTLMLLR